jgi:hypothetical protein
VLERRGAEHQGPVSYPGSYLEYVTSTGREAPGYTWPSGPKVSVTVR